MQGTTKLYLAYKPLFYEAGNRTQIVLEAEIPDDAMSAYVEARESNPKAPFVLRTPAVKLPDILAAGTFKANINFSDGYVF
jgi:hypothetical protein